MVAVLRSVAARSLETRDPIPLRAWKFVSYVYCTLCT